MIDAAPEEAKAIRDMNTNANIINVGLNQSPATSLFWMLDVGMDVVIHSHIHIHLSKISDISKIILDVKMILNDLNYV